MAAGLKFEREVKKYLSSVFGESCENGAWFSYREREGGDLKYCQIDAFIKLEDERKILIIESKLKHCEDAYLQLNKLYYPILKAYYGNKYEFHLIEVCRFFDPSLDQKTFPHKLISSIESSLPNQTNVFLWQPN